MESRFGRAMGREYDDELIVRVFSHHAGMYAAFQEELRTRLPRSFPGTSTYRVVEGGSGTGRSTKLVLEAVSNSEVVGVDCEPLMLEKAQSRFQGEPRVTLVCSDLVDYLQQQPDNSVHAFVSAFLLHNVSPEYRAQIVAEVHRVLLPGGIYLNADRCGREAQAEYFVDLAAQISMLSTFLVLGRPDQYVHWFQHMVDDEKWRFKEDEQRRLLEKSGFTSVEMIGRWQIESLFGAVK